MTEQSRTKNSIRNIIFSLITNVSQILLKALVQFFFVRYFAVEYLGLNSLYANILSILSITESGVGLVLVFAMYKPMAENDEEKIKQLLLFYKRIYLIISIVILLLGSALSFVLKYLVKDYATLDINLYVIYFIFLANTILSYLSAHRRSLFYVSQRNDIEQKIIFGCNLIHVSFQLLAILYFKNFYFFVATSILNTLINCTIVYIITNKLYKNLLGKPSSVLDKESKNEIKKNVFALFSHRIGGAILTGTDSIIISAFVGLTVLGKYSNYLLIVTSLGMILSIFSKSIQGSVGNVIATKTKDEVFGIYKKINVLYIWIVSFFSVGLICLTNPFISIIFGSHMILGTTAIIVIGIQFYLQYIRNVLMAFKDCCG